MTVAVFYGKRWTHVPVVRIEAAIAAPAVPAEAVYLVTFDRRHR